MDPIDPTLAWGVWIDAGGGFSAERIELCKKALVIFSCFDHAGHPYEDVIGMIGALTGRFTHCADGKKTSIESVSRLAVQALTGNAGGMGNQEIGNFDEFVKKIILNDFKNDSITALADHPTDGENTSIVANIKYSNKDFWNVPTNMEPEFNHYTRWDYGVQGAGLDGGNLILRYFYQHVYVGPHELVNAIHKYLKSADAPKRAGFLGMVSNMLGQHRPFAEMAAEPIDYRLLIKASYCEPIGPAVNNDYIFTRKGIEKILFYAGYLVWNGDAARHPLRTDWIERLGWLHVNDVDSYQALYGDVPPPN